MALLGNLLGDVSSSTDIGAAIGTSPSLDVSASDINVAGLVGIGDLGVGLSVPTLIGVNVSNDLGLDASAGASGGGLLGGLL